MQRYALTRHRFSFEPAAELMDRARQGLGASPMRFWYLPSLLWLDASDSMLRSLCWGGVVLAAAGQNEKAKEFLALATSGKLLPEERALIVKAEESLRR